MVGLHRLPGALALFALVALLVPGCGNQGPRLHERRGAITYEGKPVAAGEIIFAPDVTRGNDGPGGVAKIKGGTYRTVQGRGTVAGPHTARITGFDGVPYEGPEGNMPEGHYLFGPLTVQVDFPDEDSEWDITLQANR